MTTVLPVSTLFAAQTYARPDELLIREERYSGKLFSYFQAYTTFLHIEILSNIEF
jgi:type IV secretory pathway ATPase VirB11/archaellum biosynthesis ATPase